MKYPVRKKQNNSSNCLICGLKNDFGLQARFYELDNKVLVSVMTTRFHHQSYPGVTHGGISAAIIDECVGRAIQIGNENQWGMTVSMELKYHKPLPYDTKILVVSKIIMENRFFFEGVGQILLPNNEVAVSGKVKYVKIPIEKISGGHSFQENEWFLKVLPDDETEIELPENFITSLESV